MARAERRAWRPAVGGVWLGRESGHNGRRDVARSETGHNDGRRVGLVGGRRDRPQGWRRTVESRPGMGVEMALDMCICGCISPAATMHKAVVDVSLHGIWSYGDCRVKKSRLAH